MTMTPLLEINLLEESQNLKYLTVNSSVLILEAIASGRFISFISDVTTATTPGQIFIVAATGTVGLLIGQENNIAYYDGTNLTIYQPITDHILFNADDEQHYIFNGTNWVLFEPGQLTFTIPTTNLADGASYEFEMSGFNLTLIRFDFNVDSRLRIYPNPGARSADNAISTVDANSDEIFDIELTGSPLRLFKPVRLRSSGGEFNLRLFNNSGATDDVELTIYYLKS